MVEADIETVARRLAVTTPYTYDTLRPFVQQAWSQGLSDREIEELGKCIEKAGLAFGYVALGALNAETPT